MARSFNGTSTYYMEYASGGAVSTYPYTLSCWARRQGANSGANRQHFFGQATASANGPLQMLCWDPASNRAELVVRDAGGGGAEAYASWSDTGVWHHLCGCHISSGGANQLVFWLDGTAGTAGYGGDSGCGNTIRIGRSGWNDYYVNGYVAECAIWAAQLTNEEVAALAARVSPLLIRPQSLRFYAPMPGRGGSSANEPDYIGGRTLTQTGSPAVVESPPMIYPPQRRIFLPASGALSLSVADVAHSLALDALALTQQHELAVNNAALAHSLDAPTLTQVHVLALADAALAQSVENVPIESTHVLTVGDLALGQSVEAFALTQAHELAVSDSTLPQTVDGALALTQLHILAVANAAFAHALDALALTQVHVLTVANAALPMSIENVEANSATSLSVADLALALAADGALALTQAHVLVVADATLGSSLEQPTLSTPTILAVADALYAQTLDGLALTQQHTLVVSNAALALLLDAIALSTLPPSSLRVLIVAAEKRVLLTEQEIRALIVARH